MSDIFYSSNGIPVQLNYPCTYLGFFKHLSCLEPFKKNLYLGETECLDQPVIHPFPLFQEGKVKKEKGVRVGEREDTLPPDYRFKEEDLKKLPAPKPEVSPGQIYF